MKYAPVKERMAGLFGKVFQPRPSDKIEDWASGKSNPDKNGRRQPNIFLSSKESGDFAGPYDPDLNPLPTVLFDVYRSGEYKKAVFKKSSQSGVTLAVLILICWFVSFIRRNFLYVLDSIPEMKLVNNERLKPMLMACKAAASEIPEDEGDLKSLVLSLRGCVGYLCGAQSLGALSNKSVGLAVFDETDAYPPPVKGQETAVELGSERGKKQTAFFEVLLSKPIDWDGIINQEYLKGTRHKCFVPCPHCDTFQELVWERVQFEHCRNEAGDAWDYDRILKDTWYKCAASHCLGRIEDQHKPAMIARREWRRTNFGEDEHKPEPGVFSCEITDVYSTFPTATLGRLALEFVQSEGNPSKRQKFLRGRLARAKKQSRIVVEEGDIWKMCGEYRRGTCPVLPDVVLMYSDVQQALFKWVKCGFSLLDDSCWVIDYGECLTAGELLAEADVKIEIPGLPEDKWPVVYKGLIDEGYNQKAIRDFVISEPNRQGILATKFGRVPNYRFFSAWGQGGIHARHLRDLVTPRPDEKWNATHKNFPLWAYRYSDDNFKDELYNRRIAGFRQWSLHQENPKENAAPDSFTRLWFPSNVDAAFVNELLQEEFWYNPKKKRWEWKEPDNPNDFGDGVKGNLIGWYLVKPSLALALAQKTAQEAAAKAAAARKKLSN